MFVQIKDEKIVWAGTNNPPEDAIAVTEPVFQAVVESRVPVEPAAPKILDSEGVDLSGLLATLENETDTQLGFIYNFPISELPNPPDFQGFVSEYIASDFDDNLSVAALESDTLALAEADGKPVSSRRLTILTNLLLNLPSGTATIDQVVGQFRKLLASLKVPLDDDTITGIDGLFTSYNIPLSISEELAKGGDSGGTKGGTKKTS